jgi:hypothetical protein
VKGALKAAPDGGTVVKTGEQPKDATGGHFQGEFRAPLNPGLKPWAIIRSRFAAKVRHVPIGS